MNRTRLLDTLKIHEGTKKNRHGKHMVYYCSAHKKTIGYGRNISDNGLSEGEAEFLLLNDVQDCLDDLDRALPWWRTLDEMRQEALVNMVFNLGLPRLLTFKNTLARLKAKDYDGAAREAMDSRWFNQVGLRGNDIVHMLRHGTYPLRLQPKKKESTT